MNLILLEPRELDAEGCLILTGTRARHVVDVLRAAPGQSIRVGLLDGPLGTATVTSVASRAVGLHCVFETDVPPVPPIDLLLAVPRPKVLQRLWAQLAALGVGRIILTNAGRVERYYFDSHVLDPACYRPLLIEGLQQARDTRLPPVTVHTRFRVLVEDELDALSTAPRRLMAHPGADVSAGHGLRGCAGRVLLAVGPEGGWNAFEQALLQAHGFVAAGIGPRTLRTDTACVALLAVLQSAMNGEM